MTGRKGSWKTIKSILDYLRGFEMTRKIFQRG
jgi:hypothetical protein